MPLFFDFKYLLFVGPPLLLAFYAQWRVRSTYAVADRIAAPLTGVAAARHILDSAGLQQVAIEPIGGNLTDHFDPRDNVLRLSGPVYNGRTLAAVGIAAHEAGHALQKAHNYAPMAIRNAAVPVASFGSGIGIWAVILGYMLQFPLVVWGGIALFCGVVFFQLVNLPVEFNASSRAKHQLEALGIVPSDEMYYVRKVLSAAALTYVAATLQSVMVLLYLLTRFGGSRN